MKKNKQTICQEALQILEPIPENKWCIDQFQNLAGQCCAMGHLNKKWTSTAHYDIGKSGELRYTTQRFLSSLGLTGYDIARVNNGETLKDDNNIQRSNALYKSIGPKQRTILFLKDAIKYGY